MSQFIDTIAIVKFGVQHSNYAINSIKKGCCLATSYFQPIISSILLNRCP